MKKLTLLFVLFGHFTSAKLKSEPINVSAIISDDTIFGNITPYTPENLVTCTPENNVVSIPVNIAVRTTDSRPDSITGKVLDVNFNALLNAPIGSIKLSQLKGKIVLIDFWATWCGSCVAAMPHLKELQKRYPEQLQIITVTDETVKRTRQYLSARPSNLWFSVDTANHIAQQFPHQLIPHAVLISKEGRLIANTDPASITTAVIDSLLKARKVNLPEKKDILISHEEIMKTYFDAADTTTHRFLIQPEINGVSGMRSTHLMDPIFKGRRITFINVNLSTIYNTTFGDFSPGRTINKIPENSKDPLYCLDLIVMRPKDLLPALQQELLKRFDLQAKIVQQDKEVYLLKISDQSKFKQLSVNQSGIRTYYSRHGEIDQQSITMDDLADYLESYGNGKLPVINQIHVAKKYDIKFSFQPENPESLTQVLNDMGLKLEKSRKKIDLLLLFKN